MEKNSKNYLFATISKSLTYTEVIAISKSLTYTEVIAQIKNVSQAYLKDIVSHKTDKNKCSDVKVGLKSPSFGIFYHSEAVLASNTLIALQPHNFIKLE